MEALGWAMWGLACLLGIWGLFTFLGEVFRPEGFPQGPEAQYPLSLRRLISGLYALGMAGAVVITGLGYISKLNLLWFVPLWQFYGTKWIGWIYLWFFDRNMERYCNNVRKHMAHSSKDDLLEEAQPLGQGKDLEKTSSARIEHKSKETSEDIILEHPFWDDYAEAFQAAAVRKLDSDGLEKCRWLNCSLFPSSMLKEHWKGWELGIPRPPELISKEALEVWSMDITLLLGDFFKRVRNGEVYCNYSAVVERFGEDRVAKRIGNKTGLHFNLEVAYWTFNTKFSNWIEQNIKLYDCSLLCDLDEILARSDSILRNAFFPTPGPFDIGPRKRKELQTKMLRNLAPDLEKPLLEQIWE